MATLYISHPSFLDHDTGYGHPERPDRLRAIDKVLANGAFGGLLREEAPEVDFEAIARVHPNSYIEAIQQAAPADDTVYLDGDTVMSPGSLRAACRAAGAGVRAVDAVMTGEAKTAFCAVRPPGHHAEPRHAMGFCIFNNVAIAAHHARAKHGVGRVAVVDFDVHHGNGTQAVFWGDKDLFFGSTHQMPLYPGTGYPSETGVAENVVNAPLRPGDGSESFREAMSSRVFPALKNFAPDLVLISAGFDGHHNDPLADLHLVEDDFAWATHRTIEIAQKSAGGRVVSLLEGGYDLRALALSVAAHVKALMNGGNA